MTINKNTVTFTAEEYKGIMLRFSDVLTAHLNLVRAITEEETLRQKHRSYLETRAKIFGSIIDNEDMIDDACKLVDKHLGYCELCGTFDSDSEVSFENRSVASCRECGKKAEETENIEQAKEIIDVIVDAIAEIVGIIYPEDEDGDFPL